jgi:hypothetical protein
MVLIRYGSGGIARNATEKSDDFAWFVGLNLCRSAR